MGDVRTRFAPSPTGSLHLGNLRVAVFNQLLARHHDGQFIVRVEDTDLERNVVGSLEGILADLRWAGLDWDEGPEVGGPFGPYRQSQREDRHVEAARGLEGSGHAYRCFCPEDHEVADRPDGRAAPTCPGACRELSPGEVEERRSAGAPSVLRFATPDAVVSFKDEVRDDISWHGNDIGDFIILRSDGRSTYNFAVVVDDIDMEISHVIRGAGHLSNTPKQVLLFDALGTPRPVFAHLPTVLGPDRRKLSKRRGAPGVQELRSAGYHPDGVVNYLSLLGWSAGGDREVLSRSELIEAMDLGRIGASDTVFDLEKMRWVSAQHIAAMSLEELVKAVAPRIDRDRYPLEDHELPAAVEAIRTRLATFGEVNEHLSLVFASEEAMEAACDELQEEEDAARTLKAVLDHLDGIDDWTETTLSSAVREAGRAVGVGGRRLFHPVRLALTGVGQGPDLGKTLAALGPERTRTRLEAALTRLR